MKPPDKSENTSYTNSVKEERATTISGEGFDQLDYTNAELGPPTNCFSNTVVGKSGSCPRGPAREAS
jgi:hypothetical protein